MLQTKLFKEPKPPHKVLVLLRESIDWESYRSQVTLPATQPRKSTAGRKPMDVLKVLRGLVLQHLYNLSDVSLVFLLADRASFAAFVGWGDGDRLPDVTTFAAYRKRWHEAGILERVFSSIELTMLEKGLELKKGVLKEVGIIRPLRG